MLILLNKVKNSAVNVRLGQFSDYLSKNPCIFVLKLRRFDKQVTETGREFQILGELRERIVKLRDICTAQMRLIVTGCSGTVVVLYINLELIAF